MFNFWQPRDASSALRIVAYIVELTREDSESLSIYGGAPVIVDCCAQWTNWCTRRFIGDTLEHALDSATATKRRMKP